MFANIDGTLVTLDWGGGSMEVEHLTKVNPGETKKEVTPDVATVETEAKLDHPRHSNKRKSMPLDVDLAPLVKQLLDNQTKVLNNQEELKKQMAAVSDRVIKVLFSGQIVQEPKL